MVLSRSCMSLQTNMNVGRMNKAKGKRKKGENRSVELLYRVSEFTNETP
jgi:hypothetical protein